MKNIEDVYLDLEHKIEAEFDNWKSLLNNQKLAERNLVTVKAHLKKEQSTVKGEGIVIPIRSNQEQLVQDIISLSDKQLNLLERFVQSIK